MMKFILRIILCIIIFCTISAISIPFLVPNDKVESVIRSEIDKFVNVKNGYSNAELTFLSTFPYFSLVVNDIYLIDTTVNPSDTVITVDKLKINLNISTLIEKRLSFKTIELVRPYIHYKIDSLGKQNIDKIMTVQEDTAQSHPIIYLNDLRIKQLKIKYDNYSTLKNSIADNINLSFQGRINLQDSILDIRSGKIYTESNALDFEGYTDTQEANLVLSYQVKNLPEICKLLYDYTKQEAFKETKINGNFFGKLNIKGQFLDTTNNSLQITGFSKADDINVISSQKKTIVEKGKYDINFIYDIAHKDSLKLNINSFEVIGDNIYCNANGLVGYHNDDYIINGTINSKGNLTELSRQTSLLTKDKKLNGKYDFYIDINSSLNDLLHKYNFPKSINKLSSGITIPNVFGQIELKDLVYKDNSRSITSNKINLFFNGNNGVIFKTDIDNVKYWGKNKFISAEGTDLSLDGNTMSASMLINKIGYLTDSMSIQSNKIDLKFSSSKSSVINGSIEELTYVKDSNHIFGAKIFVDLLKKDVKDKETLWNAIESRIYIATYKNKDITTYGKILKGECIYNNEISSLNVTSDSIDIKVPRNELVAQDLKLNFNDDKVYHVSVNGISSRKLDFEIPLIINSLKLRYFNNNVDLSARQINFGTSDININGNINITDKKRPKIRIDIGGKYLNINEIMLAQNTHELASGNPLAIPKDSIPKGAIPRGIGKENNNIVLRLNLNRFSLSSLNLDNVNGKINIIGKEILLEDITSAKDNNSFTISSLYKYITPDYSTTTISIDGKNLTMKRLGELLPDIANASPMLSALKGTVDFSIDMFNPVRKVILLDITKAKIAAILQAKNLAISDNEEFSKIAKTLMFKNKERTEIDSLAVAATIDFGHVKILPFMLKADRYKVAMAGENSILSNEINYHISVLKSPVPFKFGINITGNKSPYKIKLVKTMYKTLDPSTKPWTDPEFGNYQTSIRGDILNFRKKNAVLNN